MQSLGTVLSSSNVSVVRGRAGKFLNGNPYSSLQVNMDAKLWLYLSHKGNGGCIKRIDILAPKIHTLEAGIKTHICGMLKGSLLLTKIFLSCIKVLNTYKRLAADFSKVMWNVPNPSFQIAKLMWLLPTWQNVNGFIVLWVLSHPLREKVKSGAVPWEQLLGQRTKQSI